MCCVCNLHVPFLKTHCPMQCDVVCHAQCNSCPLIVLSQDSFVSILCLQLVVVVLMLRHSSGQVQDLVLSSSEVSFPINAGRLCCACAAPPACDVGARLGSGWGRPAAAVGRASLDGRVAARQKSPKSPK